MDTVVFTISLIACLIVSIRPAVSGSGSSSFSSDVCTSRECRDLSEVIRKGMNPGVNPCEDFYKYVCGEWMEKPVPPGFDTWSELEKRRLVMKTKVVEIIRKKVKTEDIYPVQWAKIHFQACINQSRLNSLGVRPLLKLVNTIGGWSILGGHPRNDWTLVHNFYSQITGEGALLTIEVEPDEDFKRNVLIIRPPSRLFLRHISTSDEEDIRQYEKFLLNISLEFLREHGYGKFSPNVTTAIKDVLTFREAILKKRSRIRGPSKTIMLTLRDLQMHTRKIMNEKMLDWLRVLRLTFRTLKGFEFHDSTVIYIRQLDYLNIFLEAIDSAPVKILLDHIHFYFLERCIKHTSYSMNALFHEVMKKPIPERSIICASSDPMKRILNYLYVKSVLTKQTMPIAQDIAINVRDTLKKEISRTVWIENSTARVLNAKFDNMKFFIGYDEWYANETNVIEYYSKMELMDDYLSNILAYRTMSYTSALRRLWTSTTEDRNSRHPLGPLNTNVGYHYANNKIVVPAALLQVPSSGMSLPNAVNYGGLGTTIAHAMSRSLDSIGRYYDAIGRTGHWWTENTVKEYRKRLACYSKKLRVQTSKEFLRDKMHAHFLDNIVADYMGLIAAYQSYRKAIRSRPQKLEAIINLEAIAGDKLFFVAYATRHCESTAVRKFIATLGKAVEFSRRLRLNTAVSNMQVFANVFRCKENDPMSYSDKCEWLDESVLQRNESRAGWMFYHLRQEKSPNHL